MQEAIVELKLTTRPRAAILDDEPLIRELLQEKMRDLGYEAFSFACPFDALEATRAAPFDVVLCDIRMPAMTGIDFHARVQEKDSRQAARILFLSGDMMAPATQAFLNRSGSLYLSKPFRQSELRAKLEELYTRCASYAGDNLFTLTDTAEPQTEPRALPIAPRDLPKAA